MINYSSVPIIFFQDCRIQENLLTQMGYRTGSRSGQDSYTRQLYKTTRPDEPSQFGKNIHPKV